MKETIFWIAMLIFFAFGVYEGVMLLIQYTQNALIVGIMFYLLYMLIFVAIIFAINYLYIYRFKKGKPLFGLMSFGLKHLTNEQAQDMGSQALAYEIVLLRMDALIPSAMVFSILLYFTLSSEITTISYTEAFMLMAILESTYVLSYMAYLVILSKLLGWKYQNTQFNIEKIQATVNASLISGINEDKK
ncbi:MAG: hypothetical protein QXH07_01230 [Thermoplasmata archaeon]